MTGTQLPVPLQPLADSFTPDGWTEMTERKEKNKQTQTQPKSPELLLGAVCQSDLTEMMMSVFIFEIIETDEL